MMVPRPRWAPVDLAIRPGEVVGVVGRVGFRARSHCHSVRPLDPFVPDSQTHSAPLFMRRKCDRTTVGSGKTTLLAAILGEVHLQSHGCASLLLQLLRAVLSPQVRLRSGGVEMDPEASISYVPQQPWILSGPAGAFKRP